LNDIGRNLLPGNRQKIAKCLMRTFTCRSTFLYGEKAGNSLGLGGNTEPRKTKAYGRIYGSLTGELKPA
jgi:hypothetical protein